MRELLSEAGSEFREGNLEVVYQAGELQLGAQVKMVDAERSLGWAEQLIYTSKFTSSRLEGVWRMPDEDADAQLAVSNTTVIAASVNLVIDGTSPRSSRPVQVNLGPNETRVLNVLRDLTTGNGAVCDDAGGISITNSGAPGAVLARMFI